MLDLTSLRLCADQVRARTVVMATPETRPGFVVGMQVLLELLPSDVCPLPVDAPMLATSLTSMSSRNVAGPVPFDEVPAVLLSSVLPDATVETAVRLLALRGGAWAAMVQCDDRFRAGVPAGVSQLAQLSCRLSHVRGAWQLDVSASHRDGVAGTVVPLGTARRR